MRIVRGDDADRNIAFGNRQRFAASRLAFATGRERPANAGDDRADDPQEGPDRRDADGPGADETDLVDEDVTDEVVEAGAGGNRTGERGVVRNEIGPADKQADEHRGTDGDSDQVADTDQGEREAGGHLRGTGADAERLGRGARDHPQRRKQSITGGYDRAHDDHDQAAAVFLGPAHSRADLEHLGRGNALGIGKVGARSPTRGAAARST